MRLAAATALTALLLAAPVIAAEPSVWKVPFVPDDIFAEPPIEGTVSLVIQVWTGTRWMTDGLIVVPAEHILPVDCRTLPLGGTG